MVQWCVPCQGQWHVNRGVSFSVGSTASVGQPWQAASLASHSSLPTRGAAAFWRRLPGTCSRKRCIITNQQTWQPWLPTHQSPNGVGPPASGDTVPGVQGGVSQGDHLAGGTACSVGWPPPGHSPSCSWETSASPGRGHCSPESGGERLGWGQGCLELTAIPPTEASEWV